MLARSDLPILQNQLPEWCALTLHIAIQYLNDACTTECAF